MPTAVLYTVEIEKDVPKIIATFTYKPDDCFADVRQKLEQLKLIDFDFDFLDAHLGIRMLGISEKGNLVDECFGKVIVMRKHDNNTYGTIAAEVIEPPRYPSSGGSTAISLTSTEPVSQDLDTPWANPNDFEMIHSESQAPSQSPSEVLPTSDKVVDPHVNFGSTLMTKDLQRAWLGQIERFKEHMHIIQAEDHRWKVITWDSDGVPRGKILCVECEHPYDGSSKGLMDRVSIANCFTNFKQKHLISGKHITAVAKNREQTLTPEEIKKRQAALAVTEKDVLEEHLKIVDRVNQAQSVDQVTFKVCGDVKKEKIDLKKFKLLCTFCAEHMVMIPHKRNLEPNLEAHCASIKHLNHVSQSQRSASGLPVVSGKAGRPRVGDKRDRSQKSIQGFFCAQQEPSKIHNGLDCGASASNKGKGCIHPKSLICWGLWRENVQWGKETRPIKHLLLDQLKVDGEWYAEPLLTGKAWCLTNGEFCEISGTFRHTKCSRISELGGGFEDLTCEPCSNIKLCSDFRLRVLREERSIEKRGTRDTGRGRNLRYLTLPEIQRQAKCYQGHLRRDRSKSRLLQLRLLKLRLRSPRLGDLCKEAVNRKDILKFCNNIVLAHRRGAFGGKEALWDMLRDIASNVSRKGQGKRFRKGTKLLMQTLFLHGGRRVIDCLATNGISPSVKTLQLDRKDMGWFVAGINEAQFKFIAAVFSRLKVRQGIEGPIPVFLAEDETSVKRTVRWQPKNDTLLGFCGLTENHFCKAGMQIKVGDGEVGFNNITEAFEKYVVGHQARCVIVNPLVEGFPRLCLMATATCNRFDAEWVRREWITLDSMWTDHCLKAVGPILGHASDGDARRRKLMLHDYTGKGTSGQKVNLGWDGWNLTHSMTKDESVRHAFGLHDQDFIHNQKKLVNPLDSCARHLKLGAETVTISHITLAYQRYTHEDHGMNHEDILRTDRQNWASAQRLCSIKVCNTLCMLRERKDVKRERTLGTELYLSICADYVDIFLNKRLTLRDRVVLCGKVGFFFRLWRLWIFHGNKEVGGNTQEVTFGRSCIPMQTFLDIQISVHMVVFLIIQFRDNFKTLPVPLHLTGSDACEQFFSKVGGMRGHERAYDLAELVECATNLNRLAAMDLSEGLVGAGKSHKKHSNIWMKLHAVEGDDKFADLTDYTGIETNAKVVEALKEGLSLAQDIGIRLQMNPSTSCTSMTWWSAPWKVEKKGMTQGGWCDVNVDNLDPLDALDPEQEITEQIIEVVDLPESSIQTDDLADPGNDGVSDVDIASAGVHVAMTEVFSDLLHSGTNEIVDPVVSFEGRKMYKSTLVSQLVGNPNLSKDRLTRVKQSLYFNNLTDKPRIRDGHPSMLVDIGDDVAVFFLQDKPLPKETRSTRTIVQALNGKGKAKGKGKKAKGDVPLRPRGDPVAVDVIDEDDTEYVWWIGRIQKIEKKYGRTMGRSREPVDLNDRPGDEVCCKVRCNWFTPIVKGRTKYTYNLCDPQLFELDCVIAKVNLTVDPSNSDVFELARSDVVAFDDFVKNKVV